MHRYSSFNAETTTKLYRSEARSLVYFHWKSNQFYASKIPHGEQLKNVYGVCKNYQFFNIAYERHTSVSSATELMPTDGTQLRDSSKCQPAVSRLFAKHRDKKPENVKDIHKGSRPQKSVLQHFILHCLKSLSILYIKKKKRSEKEKKKKKKRFTILTS